MFERFTERARHVVVLAQEEARMLKHNYIGTEHLLLGLLREKEGLAARALESAGVSLERVRAEIVGIVGSGEEVTTGQIPFTPRAKNVMELGLREALSLGHNYIGTEHLLLGLAREGDGVAVRILGELGVEPERLRGEVIEMLSGPSGGEEQGVRGAVRRGARAAVGHGYGALLPAAPRDPTAVVAELHTEILGKLHRPPDGGDLLVALACLPEGVVARALAGLGVEEGALDAALARARSAAPDRIEDQLESTRAQKDEALDAGRFEDARALRARERELVAARDADLAAHVRARLGLSE
jgi:hypothetical protein